MTGNEILAAIPFLGLGLLAGLAHFYLLRRSVDLIASEGSALGIIPLVLVRFGLIAAVLWYAAQYGALPLIAGLGGFLLARIAVRHLLKWG